MTMRTPAGAEDRLAVSDVLMRYCSSVDVKDFDTTRTLFDDAATASYAGSDWLQGGDQIVAWLRAMTTEQTFQHHMLSVYHVDLDATGDEATTLSYLISHQIGAADPDTVLQMVSSYNDTLRRVDGTWKIVKKEYMIGWAEVRTAPQSLLLAEPPSIDLPGMSSQLVG